jgi:parallel beta-helix repeat protein
METTNGKNIKVINNTFNGGNGALFQTFIADTNGQTGLVAGGNSFVNCNFGIKLDTTSSSISQVRITDNYLENSDYGAVVLDDATNVVVSNNIINGTSDGTGTSGQGVDSRGGSDIIISGNLIHSIASDGIYIIGSDKITISDNKAYDIQDHGMFIDNGDAVVITGNHITANASGNPFKHGITIDDVNDLTVTGNVVKAFANTADSHGIQIAQSSGTALDHVVSSNVVIDCDKGIRSVSGADYTIITSNNVRSCTNATKIESTGAGSISANNLI